jgi:hypothetical protein
MKASDVITLFVAITPLILAGTALITIALTGKGKIQALQVDIQDKLSGPSRVILGTLGGLCYLVTCGAIVFVLYSARTEISEANTPTPTSTIIPTETATPVSGIPTSAPFVEDTPTSAFSWDLTPPAIFDPGKGDPNLPSLELTPEATWTPSPDWLSGDWYSDSGTKLSFTLTNLATGEYSYLLLDDAGATASYGTAYLSINSVTLYDVSNINSPNQNLGTLQYYYFTDHLTGFIIDPRFGVSYYVVLD